MRILLILLIFILIACSQKIETDAKKQTPISELRETTHLNGKDCEIHNVSSYVFPIFTATKACGCSTLNTGQS